MTVQCSEVCEAREPITVHSNSFQMVLQIGGYGRVVLDLARPDAFSRVNALFLSRRKYSARWKYHRYCNVAHHWLLVLARLQHLSASFQPTPLTMAAPWCRIQSITVDSDGIAALWTIHKEVTGSWLSWSVPHPQRCVICKMRRSIEYCEDLLGRESTNQHH